GQYFGGENYSGIFQDIASTSGAAYNASGWAFTPADDAIGTNNVAWIEVSFRGSATNILSLYTTSLISTSTPVGTWINLSTNNLVAPANTAFARYQVVFRQPPPYDGGSVWFDDMLLEPAST